MKPYKEINPEPTDVQRATWRRHKAAGTSPGNPKWYKPQTVKPFEFKAGLPAKFPRLPTGAAFNATHNRHSVQKGRTLTTRYVDGTSLDRIV